MISGVKKDALQWREIMKKRILAVVLTLGMALSLTACGGKKFEAGTIEGNVYTNKSIGITATAPESLTYATAEEMAAFKEQALASVDMASDEMDDAIIYEAVLMTELGSSVQIAAENMKITIGNNVSSKLYLESLRDTTKSTYEMYGYAVEMSDVTTKELGGVKFDYIDIELSAMGITVMQECYAYRLGDYMYYIIITDMGDDTESINAFMSSFAAAK